MKSINNLKNKEKSFTIIELLVVIAAIGLLAAIVIVAISGVRERAQLARTASWAATNHRMLSADNVLNLNFEECRGVANNTVATPPFRDLSGNNNHGTCTGAQCPRCLDGVPGVSGRAVIFDRADDFVSIPHSTDLSPTNITVAAWINPRTIDIHSTIIAKFDHIGPSVGYRLDQRSNNRWWFSTGGDGNITETVESITPIIMGQWTYLVGVYNRNNIRLYINGVFDNSVTSLTRVINSTTPLFIGRHNNGFWLFHGLIDDVRIYSAAMPLAYIQEQYVQGLQNLLANNAITEEEYNQRMLEFNQHLAKK